MVVEASGPHQCCGCYSPESWYRCPDLLLGGFVCLFMNELKIQSPEGEISLVSFLLGLLPLKSKLHFP